MDWPLVRRCALRYTLLAGGGSVALAAGAATYFGVVLLLVPLGLGALILLLVLSGAGGGGTTAAVANSEAGGLRSGIVSPEDVGPQGAGGDLIALFYAVGLVGFGLAALGLVGW